MNLDKCPRCRAPVYVQQFYGGYGVECPALGCMMGCWGGSGLGGAYPRARDAVRGWNRWVAQYRKMTPAQRRKWRDS